VTSRMPEAQEAGTSTEVAAEAEAVEHLTAEGFLSQ
jgi:hypothetical protein